MRTAYPSGVNAVIGPMRIAPSAANVRMSIARKLVRKPATTSSRACGFTSVGARVKLRGGLKWISTPPVRRPGTLLSSALQLRLNGPILYRSGDTKSRSVDNSYARKNPHMYSFCGGFD